MAESKSVGKQELIRRVATKAGKSAKETTDLINATLETIRASLEHGEDVRLVGFGAFSVKHTAARVGVNPQTRQQIQVPARKRVKFTPGKELNDAVARKTVRLPGHGGHGMFAPRPRPRMAGNPVVRKPGSTPGR